MSNRREYIREWNKKWRREHPDEYKAYCEQYRVIHRSQINANARKCYRTHLDEYRKKHRDYERKRRLSNPEKIAIEKLEWQQKRRLRFIGLLGGKCFKCGYNKYVGALDFHHINPDDKVKEGREYMWKFFEKLVLDGKIMLLCANCHREEHRVAG